MLNLDPSKNQKGKLICTSPAQFSATLPPPPEGKEWIKVRTSLKQSQSDDHSSHFVWKLVQYPMPSWKEKIDSVINNKIDIVEGEKKFLQQSPTFIEHIVVSSDNLAGISLKYNVPASLIKKANNMFSSNNVQALRVLRIPLQDADLSKRTESYIQDHKAIILQQFKGILILLIIFLSLLLKLH
jgi:LysM repeat protein